jgi:hypothetical protein
MEITKPLPQVQLKSSFAMPTEEQRPGMFSRRAKSPFQVRRQKLTKEPPQDGEIASMLLSHLRMTQNLTEYAEAVRKQQTLGADLAQMTDCEIMKILMNTARYLVEIQWGAVGLGYVATPTGTPVESEGFGSGLYITNSNRNSVGSEQSMLLEFPAVDEIEGTSDHSVALVEEEFEELSFGADEWQVEGGQQMMVQQMLVDQTSAQQILVQEQAATFASASQGPPKIIVISSEHNHESKSFQQRDSSGRRNAIPDGSPPPIPLKSKPKPTHTERQEATPTTHSPNLPSSDPPLNASIPSIRQTSSSIRRSVPDELHFPQQYSPTPQQAWKPNNTRATPPPPVRITPSLDSYLAVPGPNFHRPRYTQNRPVSRERPPPY